MATRTSRRSFFGQASLALASPTLVNTSLLRGDERLPSADSGDLESLVGLILDTPRNRCVEVMGEELRRGTSYRKLMAGLFHAAIRHQGAHEVAMIYSAYRISGELPNQQALLPLFWAFDSLARQIDKYRGTRKPEFRPLVDNSLPSADKAPSIFHSAMQAQDRETAERAAISLARSIGSRQAVELVWRYACRDDDDLGHKAIACAQAWRTLDTVGWEHAELPLRYILGGSAKGTDSTYDGSRELVAVTLSKLPPDWCSDETDRRATLELHEELRAARTVAAADLVCQQLASGNVKSGSVWDAIHLSAAELMLRYKNRTRGWPVHSVTSSNALHFAFRTVLDSETRLLLLLQATSRLSDQMIRLSLKNNHLRDLRIVDLEPATIQPKPQDAIEEIFSLLPHKDPDHKEWDLVDRESDDKACRMAFALLSDPANRSPFIRTACEHLNRKATWNAHDFKYPAAVFEDLNFLSERWRPHFLAASVHAIHGPQSEDTPVFSKAKEVLATF